MSGIAFESALFVQTRAKLWPRIFRSFWLKEALMSHFPGTKILALCLYPCLGKLGFGFVFPICQVRVSRFCVSTSSSASPPKVIVSSCCQLLSASDATVRTSTHSTGFWQPRLRFAKPSRVASFGERSKDRWGEAPYEGKIGPMRRRHSLWWYDEERTLFIFLHFLLESHLYFMRLLIIYLGVQFLCLTCFNFNALNFSRPPDPGPFRVPKTWEQKSKVIFRRERVKGPLWLDAQSRFAESSKKQGKDSNGAPFLCCLWFTVYVFFFTTFF